MLTWLLIAVLSVICVVFSAKTIKLFRSDAPAKEMSKKERIISGVLLLIINALGIAYLFGLNQDKVKAGVKEAKENIKNVLNKFFDDV